MTMTEELIDWIDDDDNVISVVTRSRMRAEALLHRSVGIHVWSADGRVLVHRRANDKDLHPGYWDLGAGGVVSAGESYNDAAARELAEELGVRDVRLEELGRGRFNSVAFATIAHFYRVVYDGPFSFDDGEIAEARFVSVSMLREMITTLPFMPDTLALSGPFIPGLELS